MIVKNAQVLKNQKRYVFCNQIYVKFHVKKDCKNSQSSYFITLGQLN